MRFTILLSLIAAGAGCGGLDAVNAIGFDKTSTIAPGWTRHDLNTKAGLLSVWSSGSDVVACGGTNALAHSIDGGKSFSQPSIDLGGAAGDDFAAVWGSSGTDIWLVSRTRSVLFHSTDHANTFTEVKGVLANTYVRALWGSGPNDIFIAAGDTMILPAPMYLYHSTDGGKTWPRTTSTSLAFEAFGGSGAGDYYSGGGFEGVNSTGNGVGSAQVIHSADAATWSMLAPPSDWFQLAYVATTGPGDVWFVAAHDPMYGWNDRIAHSSDGGKTITPITSHSFHDIRGVTITADGVVHLVDSPAVLKSSDHGATWTQEVMLNVGTNEDLYGAPDDKNIALAVTPSGAIFIVANNANGAGVVYTNQ